MVYLAVTILNVCIAVLLGKFFARFKCQHCESRNTTEYLREEISSTLKGTRTIRVGITCKMCNENSLYIGSGICTPDGYNFSWKSVIN